MDESERVHHQQLMEVIGWFFFDLLMLGYVEDSETGLSFRIPGGLAWAVYVEVCVCFGIWNEVLNYLSVYFIAASVKYGLDKNAQQLRPKLHGLK